MVDVVLPLLGYFLRWFLETMIHSVRELFALGYFLARKFRPCFTLFTWYLTLDSIAIFG